MLDGPSPEALAFVEGEFCDCVQGNSVCVSVYTFVFVCVFIFVFVFVCVFIFVFVFVSSFDYDFDFAWVNTNEARFRCGYTDSKAQEG